MSVKWKRGDEENETWYGYVDGKRRFDVWQDPDGVWGASDDCGFLGTATSKEEAMALTQQSKKLKAKLLR